MTEASSTSNAAEEVKQVPQVKYVDRPDCIESFADCVNHVYFDGQTLRVEFGITRLIEFKNGSPPSAIRIPSQRLVLTPAAAVELINRMQQTASALTQAGLLKPAPK